MKDCPDMSNPDNRAQGTDRDGRRYWCIKTDLSSDGEIYLVADRLEVTSDGALIALDGRRNIHGANFVEERSVLVMAAGSWTAAYAASEIDGSAVAVERRQGGVTRPHRLRREPP